MRYNPIKIVLFIVLILSNIWPNYNRRITHWQQMTLEQKVAQMIMVRVSGNYYQSDNYYKNKVDNLIENHQIGGLITFGGSLHGTFHNINLFQNKSKIPLLISADYERGVGQWLDGATLFPPNMAVAASDDVSYSYQQGVITAKEGRAVGVHMALSPVMDINNNPNNPIINFRSYGDEPNTVSKFGIEFIKGCQDNEMYACVKHFPGHGNTNTDSHSHLPVIWGSKEELEKLELKPFKEAVKAGVKMVMVGHIAMPGLDSSHKPASHSYKICTTLLREEWGFEGILITDALEMKGLTKFTWSGESAVRAVEAGSDIILLPIDEEQAINSIVKAVRSGRISESRIDESVKRIWEAKDELGLFNNYDNPTWDKLTEIVGSRKNKKVAQKIARQSITVVKDNGQLPLKPEKIERLTHIILSTDDGAKDRLEPFSRDIRFTHKNVNQIFVNEKLSSLRIKELVDRVKYADKVIVSLLVRIKMDKGISTIDDSHAKLLSDLRKNGKDVIVVSFGSPYLDRYEDIDTYMCSYGYGSVSLKAAADVLWGRVEAKGKLPINLNKEYKRGYGIKIPAREKAFIDSENNFDLTDAWGILDSAIQNQIFPGAQIFISKSGEIISSKSVGFFTYDSLMRVTNKSIYDVASLTKVMATTPIAMKLISQNKLGLQYTLDQFYPEFSTGYKPLLSVEHILTHSSGMKPYIEFFLNEDDYESNDEVIEGVISAELDYKPGTQFQYSDLGMIVLKEVIESVSKSNIDKLANSWFYNPLGMKSTFYNPPEHLLGRVVPTEYDSIYRKELVRGVVHDENAYLLGGIAGHAGLFSTAEDVGKLAQLFLNEGTWLGNRILWSSLVRNFTKRQNMPKGSDRALGWDTPSQNGKSSAGDLFSDSSYGHLGFTGTSLWIDPDKEIIIVLLTNRVHPTRKRGGIYGIRRLFHESVMKEIS